MTTHALGPAAIRDARRERRSDTLVPRLPRATGPARASAWGGKRGEKAARAGATLAVIAGLVTSSVACSKQGTSSGSTADGAASTTRAEASGATSPGPSEADGSTSNAPASSTPAWLAVAANAPIYGDLAKSTRLRPANQPRTLGAIDAVLDRVATTPATAAGLREAATILQDARAQTRDTNWTGSGTAPAAQLLHHGGMALLVTRAATACAANKGDVAVGHAADEIPLPPVFNSGGVDNEAAERDRHILREVTRTCGSKPE